MRCGGARCSHRERLVDVHAAAHRPRTRYVTPLREGGSLPGLVEADDDGLYVVKFRGAGQGPRRWSPSSSAASSAAPLGLPVPELVLVDARPRAGARRARPEIQELHRAPARASTSALDFLPGALAFDAGARRPRPELAADVVWLDALRHQRRPHAAEPEPAVLARRRCGSSTTARRCTSSTRWWTRASTRGGRCADRRPRPAAARGHDRRWPTSGSRRWSPGG